MHLFRTGCIWLLSALTAPLAGAAPAFTAPVQDLALAPAPTPTQGTAPDRTGNPAPAQASAAAPAPAPASFTPGQFRLAAPATLDQLRGGSDAVSNNIASDTQLRGTTDGNSATNVVTGNNMIQSSFSNAAGIPVVIQNSGANVLIQNATVVNLQFK